MVIDLIVAGNMERLHFTGTSKDDTARGFTGDDLILGRAGNDTLFGQAGSDWLDGGTGADALDGGSGNDTFIVDNLGDTAIEGFNNGTDTVRSSVDFTLPVNVEILVLTGVALNGTGNTLSNAVTGNAQNNTLRGEGGNDLLNGGGGGGATEVDRLNGGANADTFVLGDAGGRFYDDANPSSPGHNGYAIIEDFTPSQSDRLRLAGLPGQYFLGTSPIGGVPGSAVYHDSDTNAVFNPATDELIAVLVSAETLTVSNTLGNATYTQAVAPSVVGLTPLQSLVTNDGSGARFAVQSSIFEPMPAGVLLEIQSSTDLGFGDPWLTLASKTGPGAWTGTATIAVGAPANGSVTVTVTDTRLMATEPERFFRARLSAP